MKNSVVSTGATVLLTAACATTGRLSAGAMAFANYSGTGRGHGVLRVDGKAERGRSE